MTDELKNQKITIVIPVYNAEKTIAKLVEELIAKLCTLCSLEIVLVNDRSKDTSEKVCISLYNKHSTIILPQDAHAGRRPRGAAVRR